MRTAEPQSPKGHLLHDRLHEVKTQRDSLRLKVDLFEADAKAEFAELETNIERMERELKSATDETAEAIATTLDKLSNAFRRLEKKATTATH